MLLSLLCLAQACSLLPKRDVAVPPPEPEALPARVHEEPTYEKQARDAWCELLKALPSSLRSTDSVTRACGSGTPATSK